MAYRRSSNADFNIFLQKTRKQNNRALVPRPDTCTKVCDEVAKDNILTRLVNFFRRKR